MTAFWPKKAIAFALCLALLALVFAGCAKNASAEENASRIEEAQEQGSVTVAEETTQSSRKPVTFMEVFMAIVVLLLLWLWIEVFKRVKPYL